MTLERLHELHERTSIDVRAKASIRVKARRLAVELGQPAPAWAVQRLERRRKQPAPERSRVLPMAPRRKTPPPTVPHVSAPVELHEALRAWRAAHVGSVVQVSRGRVVLHELGAPVQRFRSMADAIAAVT